MTGERAGCLDETQALAFVAGDLPAELRDTVEHHVDDCDACRQVLAALVRKGPRAATEDGWEPGKRVGRYVILEQIGRGGMGAVYRAEDVELGRPVALKRLHAADAEARARLVREARAAAQLQHPNVVAVYEVGEDDGAPYLAMELVDGVTLTAWLRKTPAIPEIVGMLVQAGRGLAAAHERGLVHRDFKPDNVLVDRDGRARVADFGLARADDASSSSGARIDVRLARMTATGSVAGTPAYMAPELVDGAPPDAKTDQYAFAITAFEALRGLHPFAGTTPQVLWAAMAIGEIREGGRAIPKPLDRCVRRGLAIDPAERWADLAAMIAELAKPPRRRWPWLAAGGVAVAGLAVAGVVMLRGGRDESPCAEAGASIASVWPARLDEVQRALAASPERARQVGDAFARFATDWRAGARASCVAATTGEQAPDLTDRRDACLDRARLAANATLSSIAGAGPIAAAAVDSLPDLAACSDVVRLKRVGAPPAAPADRSALDEAEVALARARAMRDTGELDKATELVAGARSTALRVGDRALASRASLVAYTLDRDRDDRQQASADAMDAYTSATAQGDRDLTVEAQVAVLSAQAGENVRALQAFDGIAGGLPDTLAAARVFAMMGDALIEAKRFHNAEEAYRQAQRLRAAALPRDHHELAVSDAEIGMALYSQKKAEQALPLLRDAHKRLERAMSPLRREAIDTMRVLASAEASLGHHDEAIALDREVVARLTKLLGAHAPHTAAARQDLAQALTTGGKTADAVPVLEAVVADHVDADGEGSTEVAHARLDLANALIDLGRHDEADEMAGKAIAGYKKAKGEDHLDVALAEYTLVRSRISRLDDKPAVAIVETLALLDHMVKVLASRNGGGADIQAAIAEARGELLGAAGRWADALGQLDRALAIAKDGGFKAEIQVARGHVLWNLGRKDEARRAVESALANPDKTPKDQRDAEKWLANPR